MVYHVDHNNRNPYRNSDFSIYLSWSRPRFEFFLPIFSRSKLFDFPPSAVILEAQFLRSYFLSLFCSPFRSFRSSTRPSVLLSSRTLFKKWKNGILRGDPGAENPTQSGIPEAAINYSGIVVYWTGCHRVVVMQRCRTCVR